VVRERVCLCVREHIFELHLRSSPYCLRMLPMAVARFSYGGVAICYVLPVLWISCLHTIQACRLTLLRLRAQDNVPAASYWLHRVLDDSQRRD